MLASYKSTVLHLSHKFVSPFFGFSCKFVGCIKPPIPSQANEIKDRVSLTVSKQVKTLLDRSASQRGKFGSSHACF